MNSAPSALHVARGDWPLKDMLEFVGNRAGVTVDVQTLIQRNKYEGEGNEKTSKGSEEIDDLA